jgi:anti-anti-sigma factor
VELSATSLCGVPLLQIVGDIDHFSSSELDGAVQEALGDTGVRLLLDLSECAYLDSGGLGVLLMTLRRVRDKGWLGVIGCNRDVSRLFLISGLHSDPGFRIFSDSKAASAALAEEGT